MLNYSDVMTSVAKQVGSSWSIPIFQALTVIEVARAHLPAITILLVVPENHVQMVPVVVHQDGKLCQGSFKHYADVEPGVDTMGLIAVTVASPTVTQKPNAENMQQHLARLVLLMSVVLSMASVVPLRSSARLAVNRTATSLSRL